MKTFITLLLITFFGSFSAQLNGLHFPKYLQDHPNDVICFAIENTGIDVLAILEKDKIWVKAITKEWIYINATASWIKQKTDSKEIGYVYFEKSNPKELTDSTVAKHKILSLHNGSVLNTVLKGENVVMGYLDNGLDWNHLDFKDEFGNTRVKHLWNQGATYNASLPNTFGYGSECDSAMIANNLCTYNTGNAHGTTVTGVGSGNALANGKNIGVAPKSKLIIVKTNEAMPNWTLTVADACAYIFEKADAMGLPAVVNISYGEYLGSHDEFDPASIYMENLLEAKRGRSIVAAAGNAGNIGKWHVNFNKPITDTSSLYLIQRTAASAIPAKSCYFDMWSDATTVSTLKYSFAIDKLGASNIQRATTPFFSASSGLGTSVSIPLMAGAQQLATIDIFKELINGRLHIEGFIQNIDSSDYRIRLNTTGATDLDAWSGAGLGLSDFISDPMIAAALPNSNVYVFPDTLKTMVSSWVNSDHIITVGNVRNRAGYIDVNGNYYAPSGTTPPFKLSLNSSKGPTRNGLQKPDISACGDITLSAGPLSVLAAGGNLVGAGGMHVRNGGTSIASPVVAGLAALYLSYCPTASWQEIKNAIISASEPTAYTGVLPNYGYGYGFPNAEKLFDSLNSNFLTSQIVCALPSVVSSSIPLTSILWSNGFTTPSINVNSISTVNAIALDLGSCRIYDTINVVLSIPAIVPVIISSGDSIYMIQTPPSTGVITWYMNSIAIGTGNSIDLTNQPNGSLTATHTSLDFCIASSLGTQVTVGFTDFSNQLFSVYPNPTSDYLNYEVVQTADKLVVTDALGKVCFEQKNPKQKDQIDIRNYPKGIYFVAFTVKGEQLVRKIIKK